MNIKNELINFRRLLHKNPEIARYEVNTAKMIIMFLQRFEPDEIVRNIGGYGIIAVFNGKRPGPTVMFRSELDALPIEEKTNLSYASITRGNGHLCGHDGHMTMVAGLGYYLKQHRPNKGRVILLFQPSEENGKGAIQVIKDKLFKPFQPDYIFAIHNLPGYPHNQIVVSNNHFAASSSGMAINLKGKSSHAAEPEKGLNPGQAIAKMILHFNELITYKYQYNDFVLITPIHIRLGQLAYGTSPGKGVINFKFYLPIDLFQKKEMVLG